MGITGLLPFLKNAIRDGNLKEMSGETAAIDVYGWLHRGTFSCADKLVRGEKTDGYVRYVMKFVNLFVSLNIRPILVFDGRNLPSKAATESKRREKRDRYRKLGADYLRDGREREALDCFRKCADVTPQMAREVILEARKRGIDVIVAPYEADSQLASLTLSGIADFIVSEDSDLTVFGCSKIFFKCDINGNGRLYQKKDLNKCFGGSSNLSFEKFRYISIMSGCDYLPSLHGIGLAKSLKFWKTATNPDLASVLYKIPSYLRMPQVVVTPEYVAGFLRANETFLYQVVFDPVDRTLKPLNSSPEPSVERPFAGEYVERELAYKMAIGSVDLNTLQVLDNYNPAVEVKGRKFKSIWCGAFHISPKKEPSSPRTGFDILSTTAFASVSNKRKSSLPDLSPIKKPKTIDDGENIEEIYTKIIELSPKKEKTLVISKYFAIDSKDQCTDRKKERGRKGGEWLNALNKAVTHEDKFIYFADERRPEPKISPTKEEFKADEESDKRRNPFAKSVAPVSSPMRSPLLNLVSPKHFPKTTPDRKIPATTEIVQKSSVPKRLFDDDPVELEEKSMINDDSVEIQDTPTIIVKKTNPPSKDDQTSAYFKRKGARPSGLMKPKHVTPRQRSLFDCWATKKSQP